MHTILDQKIPFKQMTYDHWLLHALDPEDEKEKDFALQDCNFTESPTPCPHP